MGRTCSTYGAILKCIQSFVGKPEGKRLLRRLTRRWEGNIKLDFREIGCVPGDWMALVEDKGPMAGLCKGGNDLPGSLKQIS